MWWCPWRCVCEGLREWLGEAWWDETRRNGFTFRRCCRSLDARARLGVCFKLGVCVGVELADARIVEIVCNINGCRVTCIYTCKQLGVDHQ